MTTDAGMDLVAYSPTRRKAVTIQVKANEKPKPGGGKGRSALDWWISDQCPADLVALVDLREFRVWLLTMVEISEGRPAAPCWTSPHLHVHRPSLLGPRRSKMAMVRQFSSFLLENRHSKVVSDWGTPNNSLKLTRRAAPSMVACSARQPAHNPGGSARFRRAA